MSKEPGAIQVHSTAHRTTQRYLRKRNDAPFSYKGPQAYTKTLQTLPVFAHSLSQVLYIIECQRLRENRRIRRRAKCFLKKALCANLFGSRADPLDFARALDKAVPNRIVHHVFHALWTARLFPTPKPRFRPTGSKECRCLLSFQMNAQRGHVDPCRPCKAWFAGCASHLSHPGCIKNADRSAGTGDGTIFAVRRA